MRAPMAALGAASLALTSALILAPTAAAESFVDHVEWAKWGDLSSLRIYPTDTARQLARQPGTSVQAEDAWAQVLALAPDADIPGMRDQFICHWTFAELAEPGKSSWNVEPWRPEVPTDVMVAAGCNPGGTEEPF
ncbi:DUF2599 domain-containing protein [Mycolicibacterium sp. XJ870]